LWSQRLVDTDHDLEIEERVEVVLSDEQGCYHALWPNEASEIMLPRVFFIGGETLPSTGNALIVGGQGYTTCQVTDGGRLIDAVTTGNADVRGAVLYHPLSL
jgi:hypothetical protein